jgi:uncharacterized protein (TIGR03000 family)
MLMAALLATGPQAEGWHRTGSCYGCYGGGCYGVSCYGGYGSCYGSCSGGCYGGHSHGWGRGHCHGCTGGAYYGCNGFTGYSVGYTYWASGCYGSSCFGGCYGSGGVGCAGWTGGYAAIPAYSGVVGIYAPYWAGEYFPSSVQTYSPMVTGSGPIVVGPGVGGVIPNVGAPSNPPAPAPVVPPAAGATDKAPALGTQPMIPKGPALPKADLPPAPKLPENPVSHEEATPTTARIVVHLPADAKLWVDNVLCPMQGETRAFNTPAIAPGSQYAYDLTVETSDGTRSNRRITMEAGGTVEVDLRSGVVAVRK